MVHDAVDPRSGASGAFGASGGSGASERSGRRPSGGAFTLIELLVVVSILVLLIAMLLPALKRTLGRGRTVACASRIRQVGSAALSYTRDHQGRWASAFNWTLHTSTWPHEWHIRERVTEGLLYDYIQSDELYLCPTFMRTYQHGGSPFACGDTDVTPVYAYSMNASLGWQGWAGLRIVSVNSVKKPSEFMMYSEETTWTIPGLSTSPINNGALGKGPDCIAPYHDTVNDDLSSGRGNVLFVDHHVELRWPAETAVLTSQ